MTENPFFFIALLKIIVNSARSLQPLQSTFANKYNEITWKYLKGVLRSLRYTLNLKLVYKRYNNQDFEFLTAYVDSDWAGDKITRSTTGYSFKLFENCPITWGTKRQLLIANSSTAAEYMALYEAVKVAIWIKQLANSINLQIDIKYHHSRDEVENKNIRFKYTDSENQIANILT